MFDEPSSYLDVKQRLSAARTIRELLRPDDYVIVVEHDLSVLDYLSDFICVLYGRPAVYGVVTLPASVREGINIFLDGNIPTENLRFREESLTFRIAEAGEEFMVDRARGFSYPTMVSNFPFSSRALTYREGKNIGGFPFEHRRWRVHRL
jgi:ATP-binding cassette subfamily E protein 1